MEPELKEEPKAQEEKVTEKQETSPQNINEWVSAWCDCV